MQLPIQNDKYQVFLLTCPATLPFPFASYPWFVVNDKGTLSRWEVDTRFKKSGNSWGYLHKDFFPSPTIGVSVLPYTGDLIRWPNVTLRGHISGDEGTSAAYMAQCIGRSAETYPYTNNYHMLGPNSNTYVEWVLDQFPESGLSLPWNAFGKNHLHKKSR